jgi:ferritin-like metal-binding protein YciE
MAEQATTPRQLFLHELGDILFAERRLEKILPELQGQAQDEELRNGLAQHLQQTRVHVENVERVFDLLGEKPTAERCQGIEGIQQEREEHIKEVAPELHDVFNVGAAARAEHYEIATYTGLVAMADAMGEADAVRLLEANLKQDQDTAGKLEKIGKRLSKQAAKESQAGDGARQRSAEGLSREELYERAKELDIQGRSKMSKEQLREAVNRAQ